MARNNPRVPASLSARWLDTRLQFLQQYYTLLEGQLKTVPPAIRPVYEMMLLDLSMAETHLEGVKEWYKRIEEGKLS